MIGFTFIFLSRTFSIWCYIMFAKILVHASIQQLREFLLTIPFENIINIVNIKCPSEGLSLILYNFINLNPSKDLIFQCISAIY